MPAPADLIEFLATFEAEGADLEPDSDREREGDDKEDLEPDDDVGEGVGPVVTEERRARYRAVRDSAAADQPF